MDQIHDSTSSPVLTIHQNTNHVTKRVANVIMGMRGDVFEDYVYQTVAGKDNNKTLTDLNARIDPQMYTVLLDVLRVDYNVSKTVISGNATDEDEVYQEDTETWLIMPYYNCKTTDLFKPVELLITVKQKSRWLSNLLGMDIELLALDSYNLYLRPPHPSVDSHSQRFRLEDLLDRIRKKRFCLYKNESSNSRQGTPAVNFRKKVFQKCYCLVKDGWTMDDSMLGDLSYIINTWGTLTSQHNSVRERSNFPEIRRDRMLQNNRCSVCHDVFNDDDIVVNLACNHTFHYKCQPDANQGTGIFAWIVKSEKDSCPLCRDLIWKSL
jgi:hypothetical protein